MKKNYLNSLACKGILFASIISLSILINSCSSEKRFGFREKVKVDNSRNVVRLHQKSPVKTDEIITVSNETKIISAESQNEITEPQKLEINTENQVVNTEVKILVKKQITSPKMVNSNKNFTPQKADKSNDDGGKKTNGLALTGFILALAGLFIAAVILGPLAIVFSAIGMALILSNSDKYKGIGFAITGLVLGIIDLVAGIALLSK